MAGKKKLLAVFSDDKSKIKRGGDMFPKALTPKEQVKHLNQLKSARQGMHDVTEAAQDGEEAFQREVAKRSAPVVNAIKQLKEAPETSLERIERTYSALVVAHRGTDATRIGAQAQRQPLRQALTDFIQAQTTADRANAITAVQQVFQRLGPLATTEPRRQSLVKLTDQVNQFLTSVDVSLPAALQAQAQAQAAAPAVQVPPAPALPAPLVLAPIPPAPVAAPRAQPAPAGAPQAGSQQAAAAPAAVAPRQRPLPAPAGAVQVADAGADAGLPIPLPPPLPMKKKPQPPKSPASPSAPRLPPTAGPPTDNSLSSAKANLRPSTPMPKTKPSSDLDSIADAMAQRRLLMADEPEPSSDDDSDWDDKTITPVTKQFADALSAQEKPGARLTNTQLRYTGSESLDWGSNPELKLRYSGKNKDGVGLIDIEKNGKQVDSVQVPLQLLVRLTKRSGEVADLTRAEAAAFNRLWSWFRADKSLSNSKRIQAIASQAALLMKNEASSSSSGAASGSGTVSIENPVAKIINGRLVITRGGYTVLDKPVDASFMKLAKERWAPRFAYSKKGIDLYKEYAKIMGLPLPRGSAKHTLVYGEGQLISGKGYIVLEKDPEVLVARLAELMGSLKAGNTSKAVKREASVIIDKLLQAGVMNRDEAYQLHGDMGY